MTFLSNSNDDELASVLAACDDALADGSLPPFAATEALSPDQSRLLKGIECVRLMRDIWRRQSPTLDVAAAGTEKPVNSPGEVAPAAVGRFQIVKEIGRGGFGVVLLAFDPQLGRSVALKIPRPDLHSTQQLRDRFRLEAQAAGGLDHPNIVPVYEAGEADRIAYIATAFCPGVTLARWLEGRKNPIPVRLAADLVACLADGAAHAHARNVLHRDLKPANVMLWSPDASEAGTASDLAPKITDFGLAKTFVGEESDLTASGAILGTPNYLAPEQAGDKFGRISPATDIYGLGAILYELLVRRPPFDGENVLETLDQVRFQEPLSPRRLRRQVPRDLETICLKCLHKNPARRYPTATALAADLRLFLAGKPIHARPTSSVERMIRLARRNRTASGSILALLLVMVLGASGVVYEWQRAEREASRSRSDAQTANDATRIAQAARDRAVENSLRARDAVEKMTDAGMKLYREPGRQAAARNIIEQAVKFQEGFIAEESDDWKVILEAAKAFTSVSYCRETLGQNEAALEAERRASELYELSIARGADESVALLRARNLRRLGELLAGLDKAAESKAAFEIALSEFRQFSARSPQDRMLRMQLSNCLMNFAGAISYEHPNRAEAMYAEARAIHEEVLAAVPNDNGIIFESALSRCALGLLLLNRDHSSRSSELFESSRGALRALVARAPKEEDYRWHLALCHHLVAIAAAAEDRLADAEAAFTDAQKLLEDLRHDYRETARYTVELLAVLIDYGAEQQRAGNLAAAEALYRQAFGEYRRAPARQTGSPAQFRYYLMNYHASYWKLLIEFGRRQEAEGFAQRVEVSKTPISFVQSWLGRTMAEIASPKSSDMASALRLGRRSVEVDSHLPENWISLAEVQLRSGDPHAAIESLDKASTLVPGYSPEIGLLRALARHRLSESLPALHDLIEARQWIDTNGTIDRDVQRLLPEAIDAIQGTSARAGK